MRTRAIPVPRTELIRENDAGPAVSLALKNNDVPIFEFSWWRREVGASTTAAVQKILLLDFRTLHPSVMAVLRCRRSRWRRSLRRLRQRKCSDALCFRATGMSTKSVSYARPARRDWRLHAAHVTLYQFYLASGADCTLHGKRRRTADVERGGGLGHLQRADEQDPGCSGTGRCDHPWTLRTDRRTRNGGAARIAR